MGVRTGSAFTRTNEAQPVVLANPDGTLQLDTSSARGFVAIPASGAGALTTPTRGIVITTAGNLGVELADGTTNNTQLIAVVAGNVFPFAVVRQSAANTAVMLGLT